MCLGGKLNVIGGNELIGKIRKTVNDLINLDQCKSKK